MSTKTEPQSGSMDTLKWGVVVVILAAAVVGNHLMADMSVLLRAGAVIAAIITALFIAAQTMKGKAGWAFAQESKLEVRKVIWPTRQETIQTTLIVFAVTALLALVLWGLDTVLVWVVGLITGV